MPGIALPQILNVRLTGFAPLFARPVAIDIPATPGPFLIIGGNGLGKTTILQAVVFAIAGGADKHIFDDRRDVDQLWDHRYFANRVAKPKDAEVKVSFTIGSTRIEVRRGLDAKGVRGVRIGDGEAINSAKSQEVYEDAVIKASGCNSFRDFRFLVHRLCYLAEDRRSLVWDGEGQLGVSLLICGEADADQVIRERIDKWREADNEMRHVHTSIGNLEKRLADAVAKQKKETTRSPKERVEEANRRFEQAKAALIKTTEEIVSLTMKINQSSEQLQQVSAAIEEEEQTLDKCEEAFTLSCIREQERADGALALQKMLIHRQCPFCAQKASELTSKAASNVNKGLCPICGQNHGSESTSEEIDALRKRLAPKLRKRSELQQTLYEFQTRLRGLHRDRAIQEAKLDDLSAKLPRIRATDPELAVVGDNPQQIRKLIAAYTTDHERKQTEARKLKNDLDAAYAKIADAKAARFAQIQDRVAKYASSFLGTACKFETVMSKAVEKSAPFTFPILVPSFKGVRRDFAHQCSESQGFFLDIAFRMAIIDLAAEHSGHGGTFVCETPENALDLAYADNVADMFDQFTRAQCFGLLTANLQAGGVAEPLLKKVRTKSERQLRAFNMLAHAELSGVQKKKRDDLDKQFNKLVS